ncbi:Modulator of FtsH protease HflC [Burkholderiales bacterium]|nr:MAG: protease modulator HflC [Burkholderiales bacterium]CAG0982483.1 Modulator of FtsH protease HflC [Burkholderiales bacterium]
MRVLAPVVALLVALLVLASQAVYTVDQRQHAIVRQLGEIVRVHSEAGLFWKVPLLQDVKYYEKRILTLDVPEAERFLTSEKKNVLVDSFLKWRIVDVRQYYISVAGDEEQARRRLTQAVNATLREEFGKRTIHDVVSGERDQIMKIVRERANEDGRKIGVEIIDVRLKRVDLPQEVSEAVYRRMEAERKRVANELRSLGSAESERIRADADRQREVLVADAYRQAQRIKGEGDAKASAIYAAAYGQNPEFYAFYRSLEAYRASFRSKNDVLVLEPNAEFFRYLRAPGGGKAAK